MMAHPAHPGDRASQQYAPHPGELSGETWPMSMADMTEELLRARNRSRHASLIHSSAYDNRAEAAAGAAALIGATHPGHPQPAFAAPSPPMGSPPLEGRAPPAPAMASPPLAYSAPAPAQKQSSVTEARRSQLPPPLRLPMSPFLADDFELPRVVLTPPPDEEDAPITLYPRASPDNGYPTPNDRGFYSPPSLNGAAQTQVTPRSASLPTVSSAVAPQQQAPPGAARGAPAVMGFSKPTPPFGRRYTSQVSAVVMPKKPEQVINEINDKAASGGRFDAEWNELVEELPAPNPPMGHGGVPFPPAAESHALKMGSPLPFPTRPAPPPPSQQVTHQQQRSASAPVQSATQSRPETPKSAKSPKFKRGKSHKEPSTPTEPTTPKGQRRRSLSLSALFSRKRKPNFDDLPPMPSMTAMPSRPETPQTPTTPKSTTSEKRKTLLKRASPKDLFGTANADRKALRKSQSKPELHAGNRLVADDAPPVPALPSMGPGFTGGQKEHKQVVHDALAALTANSKPQPPPSAPADGPAPVVQMVPDVFAAFNSDQTSLQQRGVSAQLNGISAPSNPQRSQSPFANFERSTEFNNNQQALNRGRQTNGDANLRSQTPEPKRAMAAPIQHIKGSDKNDDGKARRRTLSKRLSISALFSKKKKDTEPAPAMPALPSSYARVAPQHQSQQPPVRQQQMPPQPGGMPKLASSQDVIAPPRPVSPMYPANGVTAEKARPLSAKPPARAPTTARVPVPRMEKDGSEARSVSPVPAVEKPVPALPPAAQQPERPSSTVKKYPDANLSKQGPLPSALAATAARLRGESPPVVSAPLPATNLEGHKSEDAMQKRQSRREQSIIPSSSSEYLRQQKDALDSHQQAQLALVQQFRSASEPIPAAGPPRSDSEQSFQHAANPFAEQAPSAEVIQQAAALVRKPAPIQVVQRAEAAYIHQRKEQAEKVEKLDEKATPSSWATFDTDPKAQRTAPLKITKKSSLNIGSKEKETAPLRIEKKPKTDSVPSTPVEKTGVVAAATTASAIGTAITTVVTASDKPTLSQAASPTSPPPAYTETPSFSFPPKPKDAPVSTLISPPARKIRRVSVPPLRPESLNSPHAAIPVPIPEAGAPFSDLTPASTPAPVANATLAHDLSVANAKLEAKPAVAPVINIITATPARSPAQSHEGTYETSEYSDQRDIDVVSPVPSETSPAVVQTAVRTSMVRTSPPILTSAADMAQVMNESEASATVESPSDSDYSLPTLESHSMMPAIPEAHGPSERATPTDESFGYSASGTPTKKSCVPAMILGGAAAPTAAGTELIERKMETDWESDMASVDARLAYLEGSSVDTHETSEAADIQTPVAPKVNTAFLSLAPATDEDAETPVATANEGLDTPVAVVDEDDLATPVVKTQGPEPAFVSIPLDNDGAVDSDDDSPDTVRAASVAGERPRSESVPPPEGGPALMPGSLSQTLPTRLSKSPVAETEGQDLKNARPPVSSIFAMAASAASMVKTTVTSAFADASEALDEIDAKIEKTVRSASPNIAAISLPATGTGTAAVGAAATATVVQTGRGSRQDSGASRRRGSSSDDGASIYTTPTTDMDSEYFDSPSASTTSFETASSNATVSPENSMTLLPGYSNKARPPSIAKFDDLPPVAFVPPAPQRRGSMPAALAGTVARLRNSSSPVPGSLPELSSVPTMPAALGISTRSLSRQGMRSATMPAAPQEIADGQAVLTPPIPTAVTSADGHGSEESSSFHLDDTDTIHDSPVEDFASLPDSPLGLHMPGNASSMYVVPFSPEMDGMIAGNEARTQTSSNYAISSGAREHVRRASGGLRNAITSAMGFTRSASDEPVISESRVTSAQPHRVIPVPRNSVNTVVDYSAPSATRPSAHGLGMWEPGVDEIEEIDDSAQGFHFRRRIDDPDSSLDSASYSSSGSDDHEGSPRTPRTPDLDALVTPVVLPNMVGLGLDMPSSPSPASAEMKKGSGTITRTRGPFRALHHGMTADDVETMAPAPAQLHAA